ncbi:MAG: hypothetical protein ACON5H_04970 [Akkermansiaceae bacterium]
MASMRKVVGIGMMGLGLQILPAQEPLGGLKPLFHASLDYFDDLQRTEEGYYRDAFVLNSTKGGKSNKFCSSAAVGVGLVALCIDHELGRDPHAKQKALETIKALKRVERDATGFLRHFFQSNTGTSQSEFSTIDTAIMTAGVLACRNTFADPELRREADQFWNSIKWESALATDDGRKLFMVMEEGNGAKPTQLFNEYFLLADLIRSYQVARSGKSKVIAMEQLPSWTKGTHRILSEPRRTPLSSFTVQFPFYLSHEGITNEHYRMFCLAQARADQETLTKKTGQAHLWGCGAGGGPSGGYRADTFAENPDLMISPHIIAGFLPVASEAQLHLLKIYRNPTYRVKTPVGELLPRFSVKKPDWRARRIEAIDYSSMVFGLAAIHPELGTDFFRKITSMTFKTIRSIQRRSSGRCG